MTSCQCEPVRLPADIKLPAKIDQNNTELPNTTCSIICPPGKSLNTDRCECTCTHTVRIRCIGLKKYNFDKCKCECTHPYTCRQNERFDTYHCVCIPIIPFAEPNPQQRIVLQPPEPTLPPCRPKPCIGNQQFSITRCGCYCPLENSRRCAEGKILDIHTCQCICPASLSCERGQYYDQSDCSCKCRISTSVCNNFQTFNQRSCQCECERVVVTILPRRQLLINENQRNKRSEKQDVKRNNEGITYDLEKRMARTKSRKKSRSRSHATRSRQQQTEQTQHHTAAPSDIIHPITYTRIIANTCPIGTVLDQNTCFCV